MKHKHKDIENELEDLKHELEHFQQEKERVRAIIGKIGGMPKTQTKFINCIFIIAVVVPVIVSIFVKEQLQLLMIETAIVLLSIKIIYLIHSQVRVNHFKFWILSAIELRVIEMMDLIKQLKS